MSSGAESMEGLTAECREMVRFGAADESTWRPEDREPETTSNAHEGALDTQEQKPRAHAVQLDLVIDNCNNR